MSWHPSLQALTFRKLFPLITRCKNHVKAKTHNYSKLGLQRQKIVLDL